VKDAHCFEVALEHFGLAFLKRGDELRGRGGNRLGDLRFIVGGHDEPQLWVNLELAGLVIPRPVLRYYAFAL
jgi:hypothetical protein